jgi:uncharacterized protein YuzB (UPF0349 family)
LSVAVPAILSVFLIQAASASSEQYFVDETESRLPFIMDKSYDAEFGDIDGDGDMDIVVANSDLGTTRYSYYLLNDGDGTFGEEGMTLFEYDLTEAVFAGVALGDIERDGDLDVVFTNLIYYVDSARHHLFVNDGSAGFTDRTEEQLPPHRVTSGSDAHFVDVDSDLDLDLVIYEWSCYL